MNKKRFSDISIENIQNRLQTPFGIFPYPAAISFVFTLVIAQYLCLNINNRVGSRADIIAFPSEIESEGSVWLSITHENQNIFVSTDDKKVFQWSIQTDSLVELQEFVAYLKKRRQERIYSAGLLNEAISNQLIVVLAIDQKLKYSHIRPILYALAEAGINQYAFETSLALTDPRLEKITFKR